MTALTITGVTLPSGERTNLHIADGHFVAEAPDGARTIDGEGLVALPGLVDPHTHLREPGREDAETVLSGSHAAARGGYTSVFAMANTTPVTDTAERAEHVHHLGVTAGLVDVAVVGAISKGLRGEELAELGLMHRSRAAVTMFSDDGMCLMNPQLMRRALEWVRPFDGVIAQHAQDSHLAGPGACCHEGELSGRLGLGGWPPVAESTIIARDVQLAEATGSRLHVCHVSTAEGVDVVRWAKARGVRVTAEVTPHHLLLGTAELTGYDTTFKVNPPLRTPEHIEAVRAGLEDGTIDMVGTDHAPHAPQDKDHAFVDARPGMLGLEQALGVVVETMVRPGRLDWAGVAERMSHAPARLGRLSRQGRPLAAGEPANLVLVDPDRTGVVDRADSASLSRNNPYHGRTLPDPVVATFLHGRETYRR